MTVLASSLKRIWSAKDWVPHRTGWGTSGLQQEAMVETTVAGRTFEKLLEFVELAQRTAPTVIVVALRLFR
jgi:hypothetical protein